MSNQWFLAQSIGNVTILEQVVRVIYICAGSKDLPGNAEGLTPGVSTTFEMFLLQICRQVFKQRFSDRSTIINHRDFH
jgi:hypothetical protein